MERPAEGNSVVLRTAGANPGDRPPAPGRLHAIQALVNTWNGATLEDLLGTPGAAAQWLAAAGMLPAGSTLTAAEQRGLTKLREAIRAVLWAHTDHRSDPEAAARLTMSLVSCRLAVTADPSGGVSLRSADDHPFARVVGSVAIAIAEAGVAGTWVRLKSCPGNHCGWAFYDRSTSGRSRWCSMQLCGSRAKMRAYRIRQARQAR